MNFRMVSYADNFEDVLLERAFGGEAAGFYIDVGAFDPVEHSITKHFSQRGWRGINIEPNPAPFARLQLDRPRDVNLNIGLSDREGSLTLFEPPEGCWSVDKSILTGWFGADPASIRERIIPVSTLARICEKYVPEGTTIDFLKVDVEGHEHEVVLGGDWSRFRPRIVLAEATKPEIWEPMLLGSGYLFAFFDGINRFYVREEDRHLLPALSVPVNVGDQFLIHGYLARINDLESRLGAMRDLGANPLAVARWLKDVSIRHPRVTSIAKRIARRMAG